MSAPLPAHLGWIVGYAALNALVAVGVTHLRPTSSPPCGPPASRAPRSRGSWWAMGAIAAGVAVLLADEPPGWHPDRIAERTAWLVFLQAGLLLARIDLATGRLPTPILAVTAGLLTGLIATGAVVSGALGDLARSVEAAVAIGGVYLGLALLGPGLVGMGDVRLATVTGLILGTAGWDTVLVGALAPYVLVLPLAAWRAAHGSERVPFGPFLVSGTLLAAVIT